LLGSTDQFTPTTEQKADRLTKPMIGKQFLTARYYLLGNDVSLSRVRGGVTDGKEYDWPSVSRSQRRHPAGSQSQRGKVL